jgi:mRNA interferase RelE/StbE
MVQYNIQFKESVRKDFRKIPKKDVLRILAKIEALADNPMPPQAEKLSGDDKYRIRQGVYRILYQIHARILTVVVVKVGHRKDVYQR